jgi:hypothetical protein
MDATKKNHYNPCFWTALWNLEYFRLAKEGATRDLIARKQVVHALSVKSGACFRTSVEGIHYDKNLGVAEITKTSASEFVRRRHPDQYAEFIKDATSNYPVFLDFENILTGMEGLDPYRTLMKVALKGSIDNVVQKANLGSFVLLQCIRSHSIMNSMIELYGDLGYEKFEHFVTLKWMLEDTQHLFNLVNPIVCCQWILFKSTSFSFPLCDSPVLVTPESIMIALSPNLLLEISPKIKTREDSSPISLLVPEEKISEFRQRTIGNTFREIIGDRIVLESWRESEEFRSRHGLMKNVKKYNSMVRKNGEREIWQINSYGNAA